MSENENRAGAADRASAPVYDNTDVPDDVLKDANRTTQEVDRGAFNPRGRLSAMGKAGKGAMLLGACFVGFVVYSMAAQSDKSSTGPDESTFRLDDASAERSARQAAQVVVQQDTRNPYALQQVGTDPFGNPIMSEGGQDLSQGGQVPAIGPEGQNAAAQRIEQERQARLAAQQREQARQDAMRRAPLMAVSPQGFGSFGGQERSSGEPFSNLNIGGAAGAGDAAGAPAGGANAIEQRLNGMSIQTVSASRLGNRNFLVTAGSQIPCVLQTAMDSTQPGLTSCVIPHDVWSANGNVILMEKGTRVLGEYAGGFSQGENRIFVLWNRAITPAGISVSLGSPAADQLGRAGMGGRVDTFFWQRFGGALLLSIVGDAGDAISNRVSGLDQTMETPNTAAAVAAQDSQRIRPRLTAPQGREMTIMVARDVDFSQVYSLRLRR